MPLKVVCLDGGREPGVTQVDRMYNPAQSMPQLSSPTNMAVCLRILASFLTSIFSTVGALRQDFNEALLEVGALVCSDYRAHQTWRLPATETREARAWQAVVKTQIRHSHFPLDSHGKLTASRTRNGLANMTHITHTPGSVRWLQPHSFWAGRPTSGGQTQGNLRPSPLYFQVGDQVLPPSNPGTWTTSPRAHTE